MAEVSVVIPCYNAAAFIGATLRSVFAQTRPPDDVVVIDDGSSDESWDVISGFGDRVRAVRQWNTGASAARNRGTAMATGDFIQYLDADDLLAPEALERKLSAAEATGADMVYSDWQRFEDGPDGERSWGAVVAREISDVDPDPELAAFTTFWAPPAALLYRRALVDRIGGWHDDLPVIQDARFLQDAVMLGARLQRVPEVLAFYREPRPGSLSRRSEMAFKRDVLQNAMEIEDLWRARDALTQSRIACLARGYRIMARWFFWCDSGLFAEALARAKRLGGGHGVGWEEWVGRCASWLGAPLVRALLWPFIRCMRFTRQCVHRARSWR